MSEDTTEVFRSVSQVNDYDRCPYMYYLKRVEKVWSRPAAWTAQGTAFHEVAERYEKEGESWELTDLKEAFKDAYAREIAEELKTTPWVGDWFWSGPYKPEDDIPRRLQIGLEQVEFFWNWKWDNPDYQTWISPDDTPIIEYHFQTQFGDVKVRGFIDSAVPEGIPVDYKTGKTPGNDFQLATYAGVFKQEWDIPFTTGQYWMAAKKKPVVEYDLTDWSLDRLADVYGEVDEKIRAEDFPPLPEKSKCMFCSVRSSCEYAED